MSRSLPTERAFVGSLIATPDRPQGQYGLLAHVNWNRKLIKDRTCQITLRALELANSDERFIAEPPTPQHLARIILIDNLAEGDLDQIADDLTRLADHGSAGLNWLQSMAQGLHELHIEDRLKTDFVKQVQDIANSDIGTANTKWGEIAAALDAVRPDFADSAVLDEEAAAKLLKKIVTEGEARIARRETPPYLTPELGDLMQKFDELTTGLLYIVSGLNSTGKSSLLHQIAEGMARTAQCNPDGSRPVIAIFHLEDDHKRVLWRSTCRLTGASMKELRNGDPRKMMFKAHNMKKRWPGQLVYVHCPGATAAWIAQQIAMLKPYAVFIDYAQKLDTTALQKTLGTKAAALSESIEILKRCTENPAHKTIMWLGSQEADYDMKNGGKFNYRTGTGESRDIERKAQGLIRIQAYKTETPIIVDGITLAQPGEYSPFVDLVVEKSSDTAGRGGTTKCIMIGGRFKFEAISYREWRDTHPGMEFPPPDPAAAPTQEFFNQHAAKLEAYEKLHKVKGEGFPQETPKPVKPQPPASDEPTEEIPF